MQNALVKNRGIFAFAVKVWSSAFPISASYETLAGF